MSDNLFDASPSTSAERAIAATAAGAANAPERQPFFLYVWDIYDPDIHPPEDQTRYVVPKENWLVFDPPNGVVLRVEHVDTQGTNKSTLVPWNMINGSEDATTEQDWIFGLRGGPMIGEALLSIDYSQRPNVAKVDGTIMRPGAAYAKVYKGSRVDETKVISAQYDQSLNKISNFVPVKLALIEDHTNKTIMTTGSFSVIENAEALPDGERCFLAFFDEGDNFIPPAQILHVQHCSYMKDHKIGTKYVTDIQLLSPWFTNTMDPELLVVPINVVIPAVELRAVVLYSDGSVSDPQPVNGERFTLYGLSEYRPTWPGQSGDLPLIYKLQPNEAHYIPQPGNPDFREKTYRVEAGAVKGAWSPRLYTYPVWDPTIGGYKLKHWLYDLDRKYAIDVTEYVTFNDQSEPWRPKAYGISQGLIFNLNLKSVSQANASITFMQYTTIILYKDINGPGKRWDVAFSANKPYFGGKFAQVANASVNTTFNLKNGYASKEEWLVGMYRGVDPSYNRWDEERAPDPTHFYMTHPVDGRRWAFSVDQWDQNNAISIELQNGQTWTLQWVQRDSTGAELQLASSGITIQTV